MKLDIMLERVFFKINAKLKSNFQFPFNWKNSGIQFDGETLKLL